jgi:dUTP pyrophosphatase
MNTYSRTNDVLYYKLLSTAAFAPAREHGDSKGFLLKSPISILIPSKGHVLIDLFLEVILPSRVCAHMQPRSGLSSKHSVELGGGEPHSDYEGSLKVKLYNHSSIDFMIERGTGVAELICEKIIVPDISEFCSACLCHM